jgi:uncharacterized protein YndB with AHSA1/START domain
MDERLEVTRHVNASPEQVFAVLCDPQGHVAIDASGMLQDADGDLVSGAGDTFVVHMDRESLGDLDMGKYDVTVHITAFEQDREIAWTIIGTIKPPLKHVYGYRLEPQGTADAGEGPSTLVTSYYDWSEIDDAYRGRGVFPVISESALKATLGILDRTVRRGYLQG